MSATPRVVVVGGGIAALETTLALRDLAGDRVAVTLIAAEPDLVLRPLLMGGHSGSVALRDVAAELDVELRTARVSAVRPEQRQVWLSGGDAVAYDTLVLAPGARSLAAFDGVITLGDPAGSRDFDALLAAVDAGEVHHVGFIVTARPGWPLPAYEAALRVARRMPAEHRGSLFLVTPEAHPLDLFGPAASAAVARALSTAGVEFVGSQLSDVIDGSLRLPGAGDVELPVERIVATPLLRGPGLAGVPEEGVCRLIGVDEYGRVVGLRGVYAAGDATTYPVKHGTVAAQQALAVAEQIAASYGAPVIPKPFDPALGAVLVTGDGPPLALGAPTTKLPGRYLGPYLERCGFPAIGHAVPPDVAPSVRA